MTEPQRPSLPWRAWTLIVLGCASAVVAVSSTSPPGGVRLTSLKKIYLATHPLAWLEITPTDPRRQTKTWEQWPGRCEIWKRCSTGRCRQRTECASC